METGFEARFLTLERQAYLKGLFKKEENMQGKMIDSVMFVKGRR